MNIKIFKKNFFIIFIFAVIVMANMAFIMIYRHIYSETYVAQEDLKLNIENDFKNQQTAFRKVHGITNVLLVGIDARNINEKSRSDSIIIATVDSNNKKVKFTSIFRDTLVNIPEVGESKINASYAIGGIGLLLDTLKETYNINIDKYVILNFKGFEEVIEAIGGVEIDVEDYQLKELNKYIGESTGGNDCPITDIGLQKLNGKQTLSYARIRYDVGDEYGRTARQREVLSKVLLKAKSINPVKYITIINSIVDNLNTNMEPLEMINLAYTVYKFPEVNIEEIQIPVTNLSEEREYKNLGACIIMDRTQNANIINSFIFEDKQFRENDYDYEAFRVALSFFDKEQEKYDNISKKKSIIINNKVDYYDVIDNIYNEYFHYIYY